MITEEKWQEMKVAEKREWLREHVVSLNGSVERMWIRQRKLMARMRKVEAVLGIASPDELVAVN